MTEKRSQSETQSETRYDATGEPETKPHDWERAASEAADSNPNAAPEAGLAGDMGVSSERDGDFAGVESTGTLRSAQGRTHGAQPTSGGTAHSDLTEERDNPADVPPHDTDLEKNPGHGR